MTRATFLFLLLASAAHGQVVAHAGSERFVPEAPPVSLTWTLSSDTGNSVSATVYPQLSDLSQLFLIRESNAADFGVDWAAWQLAVNDPAYDLSSMTFGSQQSSALRPFRYLPGQTARLDLIRISASPYAWPSTEILIVSAYAFPPPVVPEPSTWLLLILAALQVAVCSVE